MDDRLEPYGLLAEFENGNELVEATKRAYGAGYRKIDAYSPIPIEALADAMHFEKTRVPLVVLIGGLVGGIGGYLMQYYMAVIDYPINIGGRPLNSWPAFIPPTFELVILCAAGAAVLGMLALNGLPMPYHPLFNVERFSLASQDRFFLCIEADDAQFDMAGTRKFLESLNPLEIEEVEP